MNHYEEAICIICLRPFIKRDGYSSSGHRSRGKIYRSRKCVTCCSKCSKIHQRRGKK